MNPTIKKTKDSSISFLSPLFRKISFVLFLFFAFGNEMQGQCPAGNITLTTQAEVDAFAATYPGCTNLLSSLTIGPSTDIVNLNGLSNITSIIGLSVKNNSSLTSLSGLNSLASIEGVIQVLSNPLLTDFDLSNVSTNDIISMYVGSNAVLTSALLPTDVTTMTGYLQYDANPLLVTISEMNNLTSIGEYLAFNNTLVSPLPSLPNLTSIGTGLYLRSNANITAIPVFASLNSIGRLIEITGNLSLTDFDLSNISTHDIRRMYVGSNAVLTSALLPTDVTTMTEYLQYDANPLLVTISEMNNLISIGQYLAINNTIICSFPNFPNLISTGTGFYIGENANILTLPTLSNTTTINGIIDIRNNPNLSYCSIDAVCNYIEGTGNRTIYGNSTDCLDEAAVSAACTAGLPYPTEDADGDGFTVCEGDCDNDNNTVYPGAPEICDGIDNDCDGEIDEAGPCPGGNVTILSQQDLDDYVDSYGGCHILTNSLTIGPSSDITNLDALSCIEHIAGELRITDNSALQNISGLSNDIFIGVAIKVQNNPILTNIDFSQGTNTNMASIVITNNTVLETFLAPISLQEISNWVHIYGNSNLVALTGFDNLNSIGAHLRINDTDVSVFPDFSSLTLIGNSLTISGNSNINSLNFSPVVTPNMASIVITNNSSLTNFDAPTGVQEVSNWIHIYGNTNLSTLTGFDDLSSTGNLRIQDTDIAILPNLSNLTTVVGQLRIQNNSLVSDLNWLSNIISIGTQLKITDNPLLSNCSIDAICDFLIGTGDRSVSNNTGCCFDETSVSDDCTNNNTPLITTNITVQRGSTISLTIANLPANAVAIWYGEDMTTVLYQDAANNFQPVINEATTFYSTYLPAGSSCNGEISQTNVLAYYPLSARVDSYNASCSGTNGGSAKAIVQGGAQSIGTGNFVESEERYAINGFRAVLDDFNGDGYLDVYSSTYYTSDNVWLNDGDGTYTYQNVNYNSEESGSWSTTGDFDNDGDKDIYVTNTHTATDKVLINDGSGFFTEMPQSYGVNSSQGAATGDLNDDGNLDVMVTGNGFVIVLLGNGDGTFSQLPIIGNTTYQGRSVKLGDLDNDGDLDAFVTNGAGLGATVFPPAPNKVYLNDGNANFTTVTEDYGTNEASWEVDLGDLDGDGDLDAMIANWSNFEDQIYLNDGDGTFTLSTQNFIANFSTRAVDLADMDRDGDLDAVFGHFDYYSGTGSASISYWTNDGAGNFVQNSTYPEAPDVAIGDLDRDGDLDIFSCNGYAHVFNGRLHNILYNDDSEVNPYVFDWSDGLQIYGIAIRNNLSEGNKDVNITDADGNIVMVSFEIHADDPIALTTSSTDASCSIINDGTATVNASGGAPFALIKDADNLGNGADYDIVIEDMDSDGDLDILSGTLNRVIGINDGLGNFTEVQEATLPLGAYPNLIGDLNGDGHKDILGVGQNSGNFGVYLSNGNLTYQNFGSYSANGQIRSGQLGDLDGDGDLDVFLASANSRPNYVFLNDGTGIFSQTANLLGTEDTWDVKLGDLDGDGDLDALTGNLGAGDIVWLNDGNANFTNHFTFPSGIATWSVELADFDADGDLDAVVDAYGAQPSRIYFNNGDATFSIGTQMIPNLGVQDVEVGDIDGDGDVDILTNKTYYLAPGVRGGLIWLNDGSGSFIEYVPHSGSPYISLSFPLETGDLDNDGDLDVVTNGGVGLQIFRNTPMTYSYQWSANANSQTTATAENLAPGTYSVTATNLKGCNASTSVTVVASIIGEPEICDGIDNDCDGEIDEGFDMDGDGFTSCNGDCNDDDPNINPNAEDIACNGIDEDCDNFDNIPTPPTLTEPSLPTSLSCELADGYVAPNATYNNGLSGVDNISGSILPTVVNAWDACGGIITVSYSAQDACGNLLEAGPFTINVLAAPTPTLTPPTFPTSISCDEADNFSADNANYSNSINGACGISGSITPTIVNNWDACGGTITVSYSGQDECGRTIEAGPFTINVMAAPVATLNLPPLTSPISCDEADNYVTPVATYSNSLNGDCNISGSITATLVNNWDACGGIITVSYNGQDECGRTLSAGPFTINVQAAPVPTIILPTLPNSISCEEAGSYSPPNATVNNEQTGACNISGNVSSAVNNIYDECGGTLEIIYFGKDECGRNLAAVITSIIVEPAPAPTLSVPSYPMELSCGDAELFEGQYATYSNGLEGNCEINGYLAPTVIKNVNACEGGIITILYEGLDHCGNQLSSTPVVISVTPAPLPTIQLPDNPHVIYCWDAMEYDTGVATFSNGESGICENAGELELTTLDHFWNTCDGGYIVMQYSGYDNCGNYLQTDVFKVAVLPDTWAPVGECVDLISTDYSIDEIPNEDGLDYYKNLIANNYTDYCGEVIVTVLGNSGVSECDDNGTFEQTFQMEVSDECGNVADTCALIFQGNCNPDFCTFTQKTYANPEATSDIINTLIDFGNEPISIGEGECGFTLDDTDCIQLALSGQGQSISLSDSFALNCNTPNNNALVNQVITTILNIRYNELLNPNGSLDFGNFQLSAACARIPGFIQNSLPDNPTINDLINYANNFIGCQCTGICGEYPNVMAELTSIFIELNVRYENCRTPKPCDADSKNLISDSNLFGSNNNEGEFSKTSNNNVHCFPNPTNGEMNIRFKIEVEEPVHIQIFNVNGIQVYTSSLEVKKGIHQQKLNLVNLESGLYILTINGVQQSWNSRFVKF